MNGDSIILLREFPFDASDAFTAADHFAVKGPVDPITHRYSGPLLLIRLVVLALVPFILVDAAMYQLQMFLAGGRTPITPAILKVGLLGAFTAAFLLRGRIRTPPATKVALAFVAYLALAALHQYFNLGVEPTEILLGYNAYYLLPLLGVLALATPVYIPDQTLILIILAIAVVCGGLGIAQYVTNSPLVPTFSTDGYFKVLVWSTAGRVRVFSLFAAPASCGAFFCFTASLAVAMARRRKNLIIAIPLLLLSLFVSWASDARTTMIATLCGIVTSWIVTFNGTRNRTKYLPFIWLAFGTVVAAYAYTRTLSDGPKGLVTDASSFAQRFARWSSIIEMFRSTSAFNIFVGYGLVQGAKLDKTGNGGSDNLYLALILHIGVIGLCIMLLLLWNLWQAVRKEAEKRTSYLTTAVAATYSTLLLAGLFDISSFGMFFLIFALSSNSVRSNR